jgi:hypothetical protein
MAMKTRLMTKKQIKDLEKWAKESSRDTVLTDLLETAKYVERLQNAEFLANTELPQTMNAQQRFRVLRDAVLGW